MSTGWCSPFPGAEGETKGSPPQCAEGRGTVRTRLREGARRALGFVSEPPSRERGMLGLARSPRALNLTPLKVVVWERQRRHVVATRSALLSWRRWWCA